VDSGKTPGTDLREGIPTLPVLYALQSGDADAGRLRGLIAGGLEDDAALADALAILRAHPAMGRARADLASWSLRARECLAPLPAGPARTALESLADFVVDRTS
ncbi:MAG: polyprenyl synthetase family protein, partial [Frankia sp.]